MYKITAGYVDSEGTMKTFEETETVKRKAVARAADIWNECLGFGDTCVLTPRVEKIVNGEITATFTLVPGENPVVEGDWGAKEWL